MSELCFVNSNKAWGGGEKWVLENARMAVDAGHSVLAVTNTASALGDRLDATGVAVHRMAVSNCSFLNPVKALRLKRLLQRHRIRSVVFSLPSDLKLGGLAARWANVENVVYRRGIALPVKDTALNRLLYGSALTHFICNSEETKRLALSNNPDLIKPSRISIIYNGVTTAAPEDDPAAQNAVPGLPQRGDEEAVIGFVGRLTHQKNLDFLLRAVALLKHRGRRVKLLVAGCGELEREHKDAARSYGLAREVDFLGFVESTAGLYRSIDVLAHPALWEGFGYAIAEAMVAAKPVVALNVSSNPELIRDGETGYLCSPDDVDGYADRLETLILGPNLRTEMGRAGRRRVQRFSKEAAFSQLMQLLA